MYYEILILLHHSFNVTVMHKFIQSQTHPTASNVSVFVGGEDIRPYLHKLKLVIVSCMCCTCS